MGNKLLYAGRRPLSRQFSQRKSQLGLPARLIDIARITYFQDYFLEQPHIVGNTRLEIHIVGNMRECCQQYVFPGLLVTVSHVGSEKELAYHGQTPYSLC